MTDPARTKPSRTAPARRTWSLATVGLAAAVVITFVITAARGPGNPPQSATGGPPPMGWSSWSFLRAQADDGERAGGHGGHPGQQRHRPQVAEARRDLPAE
ncbi:MAG TPA: hypothetical protein VIY52_05895 [Streptosporangiaceae bacterium]